MLPLTRQEQAEFDASVVCPKCLQAYTDENKKVRHHDHKTGNFISAVCNTCNLVLKPRKRISKKDDEEEEEVFFIPTISHNLKNYDAHHIFRYFNYRQKLNSSN